MPLALKEKISNWLWQLLEHRLIAPVQPIDILLPDGSVHDDVLAAVDIQSEMSSIDRSLVKELGLQVTDSLEQVDFMVHGRAKLVPAVTVNFRINGQVRTGKWAVVSRSQEKNVVCLGKADLGGFLVDVPDDRNPQE
jgi:hypothetical protein